jgi:serine/threonine protein kinase
MDMRYLKYVISSEKYYEPPKAKAEETQFSTPIVPEDWQIKWDSHWTYCVPNNIKLPPQGWKIHVSANADDAQGILDKVASFLIEKNILFKFVSNELELLLKNSKYGDRGSSGKFITIYPMDEPQFISLLQQLHELLKEFPKGPYILSDKRWMDGNIYFRYGGFVEMFLIEGAQKIHAIMDPSGKLIPDIRGVAYHVPDFIEEPKIIQDMDRDEEESLPEHSRLSEYEIKSALHFSNGGGVYLADWTTNTTEVVLKEGRPGAGLDGQNRDATTRLTHEAKMLKQLNEVESVVNLIDIFEEWEHIFLVEEYIEGMPFNSWLASHYPFSRNHDAKKYVETIIPILKKIKHAVEGIHSCNIGMGDLQPANIMITETNDVKLIDFEAASELTDSKRPGLQTPAFTSTANLTREQADWFALLRIVRHAFAPIGPVQDLAEDILKKHDKWIYRHFGKEALAIIEEVEAECMKRNVVAGDSLLDAPTTFFDKSDLPELIEKIREGIVSELREDARLLPGDIRQFETEGLFDVLTGGFGVVWALAQTGTVPSIAKEWATKFSREEYIRNLDEGLFTGKAGIAGVLYEIGMIKEAKVIYDSLGDSLNIEDVSLKSGLAGTGLALLSASTIPDFEYLQEKAIAIGKRLEILLNQNVAIKPDDPDAIAIGLIEGWSGVSLFFSTLCSVTGDKNWLDLSLLAIEKDTDQCVFDEFNTYHVDEVAKSRIIPYISGGSAGVGLAMIELRTLLGEEKWEKELIGTGNTAVSRCCYSPGLFRGLAGLIIIGNALENELECIEKDSYINKLLETLNLYVLEKDGQYLIPGDFTYRLSGDIFSGSSGMLLALSEIGTSGFSWLPIPKVTKIFPSHNKNVNKASILKGGEIYA